MPGLPAPRARTSFSRRISPASRTWRRRPWASPWPSSPPTWATAKACPNRLPILAASAQTLLAFDYGTHRIGVAVGQSITKTASALPVLKAKKGEPDWGQLDSLVNQWNPGAFVIGMPYNMDGSENDMTVKALAFAKKLEEKFSRPFHTMDERLSTREAKDISRSNAEAGGRKFNDKSLVDSFAAQLILESWLSGNS